MAMARAIKDVWYGKTMRKSFARSEEILDMPYLLEIQKESYKWFLEKGLQEVFNDVDSITDYAGNLELTFISFSMDDPPKYTIEECKAQDMTYAAPMKVQVHLRNKATNEIKEQSIFMGDFPIMTDAGTFVINGAERVIVSQLVRSPGVYFSKNADKADNITFASTVIPYRGAWLEYETDLSDVFYVRIDKNRKLPVTCLIRAIGPRTDAGIVELFGEDPRILATLEKDSCKSYEESMLEIYRKLRPGEPPTVDSAESLMNSLFFDPRRYDLSGVGRYKFNKKLTIWTRLAGQKLGAPVADPATGEIVAEAGEVLTRERARELDELGVNEAVVEVDDLHTGTHMVKVFSNGMVDMKGFVSFAPEECGITESVRYPVLMDLIAQANGDEETAELISQLSALFRGFINAKPFISLKEELALGSRYLTLLNARYGDQVRTSYDIANELLQYGIIRNVFQILIENYFVHGFRAEQTDSRICFTGRSLSEEDMVFYVEDNGAGMTREELQHLNARIQNPIRHGESSYGLKNLNQRLKLFYGPGYGLHIAAGNNGGIRIEITMKKMFVEEYERLTGRRES